MASIHRLEHLTVLVAAPLFIERANGAYIYDADGRAYLDYVGSWGPMVLSHNHPAIRHAVTDAVQKA